MSKIPVKVKTIIAAFPVTVHRNVSKLSKTALE